MEFASLCSHVGAGRRGARRRRTKDWSCFAAEAERVRSRSLGGPRQLMAESPRGNPGDSGVSGGRSPRRDVIWGHVTSPRSAVVSGGFGTMGRGGAEEKMWYEDKKTEKKIFLSEVSPEDGFMLVRACVLCRFCLLGTFVRKKRGMGASRGITKTALVRSPFHTATEAPISALWYALERLTQGLSTR